MGNNAGPIIPDTQQIETHIIKGCMHDMTAAPGGIGKSRKYGLETNTQKDGIRAKRPPGGTGWRADMTGTVFKKVTGRHSGYGLKRNTSIDKHGGW
jgi:hypothetical protein